jgi:phenylpropionate dioxygenase-like ring-hydroxylating dioxygenase large terminal subunit
LSSTPLARTLLGEHVVLYRTAGGSVVALPDRCPHRRYPLSRGRCEGDLLVCGYHGFTFDESGQCVAVPGQDRVPSRADLRPYELVQHGPWIYIWMGDLPADHGLLPVLPWLEAPGWAVLAGKAYFAARFQLFIDNLVDLSHETYLHPANIGTPEVAATPVETEVDEEAGVVRVLRRMFAVTCPPFYSKSTGIQSPVDRWQDVEYLAPGFCLLHSRIAPAGVGPRPDGTDPGACHTSIVHAITPETATTTFDFWTVSRDFAVDDDTVHQFLNATSRKIVAEDLEALEALEARLVSDGDDFEVNVRNDRAGLAARRILAGLAQTR